MSCPDSQGGEGASGPGRALMSWMFSFEDGPNATTGDRFVVPERRAALGKQRRDYIAAMDADAKASGWQARFAIDFAPDGGPADREEVHGDRAAAVGWYAARFTAQGRGGPDAQYGRGCSRGPGIARKAAGLGWASHIPQPHRMIAAIRCWPPRRQPGYLAFVPGRG
jgi:hypothetical protein